MIGHVLLGMAAGAVGSAAHLAAGGGILGAVGIYSLGGSAAIAGVTVCAVVAEGVRDRRQVRPTGTEVRPRAGRVPAARRPAQASRATSSEPLRHAL